MQIPRDTRERPAARSLWRRAAGLFAGWLRACFVLPPPDRNEGFESRRQHRHDRMGLTRKER